MKIRIWLLPVLVNTFRHRSPQLPSKIVCFNRSERIAGYQRRLLMRMDFPLTTRINQIIQNAFESELLAKGDRDNQRKKEFVSKPALKLEQYSVALVIVLGIGFTGASVINIHR